MFNRIIYGRIGFYCANFRNRNADHVSPRELIPLCRIHEFIEGVGDFGTKRDAAVFRINGAKKPAEI